MGRWVGTRRRSGGSGAVVESGRGEGWEGNAVGWGTAHSPPSAAGERALCGVGWAGGCVGNSLVCIIGRPDGPADERYFERQRNSILTVVTVGVLVAPVLLIVLHRVVVSVGVLVITFWSVNNNVP